MAILGYCKIKHSTILVEYALGNTTPVTITTLFNNSLSKYWCCLETIEDHQSLCTSSINKPFIWMVNDRYSSILTPHVLEKELCTFLIWVFSPGSLCLLYKIPELVRNIIITSPHVITKVEIENHSYYTKMKMRHESILLSLLFTRGILHSSHQTLLNFNLNSAVTHFNLFYHESNESTFNFVILSHESQKTKVTGLGWKWKLPCKCFC